MSLSDPKIAVDHEDEIHADLEEFITLFKQWPLMDFIQKYDVPEPTPQAQRTVRVARVLRKAQLEIEEMEYAHAHPTTAD